jgi:hypothetical protein
VRVKERGAYGVLEERELPAISPGQAHQVQLRRLGKACMDQNRVIRWMPVEQHRPAKVAVAVDGVGETGRYRWNAVDDQTRRWRYNGALRQKT